MINILDLFEIGEAITTAFRTFFGYIAAIIYSLIEYLYHVFELVGRAEIINSDFVKVIYKNVGLILSIFMLFKLIFSLIQSLIEPNKLGDKKDGYGQIILRCVISIVLLGITPAIFREAYTIQNFVVGANNNENILYKLVAGNSTNGDTSTIGRTLSATMYFDFFTDSEPPIYDGGMVDNIYEVPEDYYDRFKNNDYETLKENVMNGNMGFFETVEYLSIKEGTDYVIEVNWIPLLLVGGFILWTIAMYTIQIGVRAVQLAYLQLIAPIPILTYISDPDGTFKKWIKQCTTTYLDLFFRLLIIYFVMTLIGNILAEVSNSPDILFASTGLAQEETITQVLVVAVIIIGLLLFAKKVPELLKDLFPNLGGGSFSFGLNPKKNVIEPLSSILSPVTKPVGWVGKKAWKYSGGKAVNYGKNRYEDWKNVRKEEKQANKQITSDEKIYGKYGTNFENKDYDAVFGKDYADSFRTVKNAKSEMENALVNHGRNSQQYIDAEKKYNAAKEAHELRRKGNHELAAREDALKRYQLLHPTNSSRSNLTNSSQTSSNQQNNRQMTEEQRQQLYSRAAQQANRRPSSFTAEERQRESQRRESMRSSDNNDREAELARRSIFSDNEAMRQSDEGFRVRQNVENSTGINRESASSNGAPTAQNSIFNDDEAMRQSDAQYNSSNNTDTRVYQNWDDVGE